YEYPICSSLIFERLSAVGSNTRSCSELSSNNQESGTSNSLEILDKVATAEDVCPFSIFDNKLLEIPHASAICCCVFLCRNRNCLIFVPMLSRLMKILSLQLPFLLHFTISPTLPETLYF